MKNQTFTVRKVAILGAGVMGAQIAAHLVNANVAALLFDLPAKEGDPNGHALKALEGLKKLDPSPLSVAGKIAYIDPANYEQHLPLLQECDIVIEAISERMDWKIDLYKKVAPHLGAHTIFATNTSGLSINKLAQAFPEELRHRFCGIHFFNPPRYMHLVELIACEGTEPAMLDQLEQFLVTTLGKGVIRAKDTPNFIANRIGVFSMLATVHHAQQYDLGFDLVDALTGPSIGRPKSATFRTADVVGLDVFAHVVGTMRDTLPDDPWQAYFKVPDWLQALIDKGALGQKSKCGVYRKVGKEIQVLDLAAQDYRPAKGEADAEIQTILKNKNWPEKLTQLRTSKHPQAQFLWAIFRDLFHYSAVHLASIADNARDLDLAVRWGFGWRLGPFEIWQASGWSQVTQWIQEDIAAGKSMAQIPLPDWVSEPGREGVHSALGAYSPTTQTSHARSTLPVYQRQLFPDAMLGEPVKYGDTIFETDAVRLWHGGDDIAILSFKTKMHVIGKDVLDGMMQAVDEAERNFKGLVIWQSEAPFSAGANLLQMSESLKSKEKPSALGAMVKKIKRTTSSLVLKAAHRLNLADALMAGKLAQVEAMIADFQQATMALKYANVPTVAAVDGLALGGGCELAMHCDRAVVTLESYIGLVEVGVGLLPAGGGCKELTLRAAAEAKGGDISPFLQRYFKTAAMGEVAKSGEHAKELGYLRASDIVVMNKFELLHVAKAQALALFEAAYRPPLKVRRIPVLGKTGIATLQAALVNMRAGEYISEHDYLIGSKVASVMCGGALESGSLVDEDWLLDLERSAFIELLATEKTQARIEHMLKTGKPLRN